MGLSPRARALLGYSLGGLTFVAVSLIGFNFYQQTTRPRPEDGAPREGRHSNESSSPQDPLHQVKRSNVIQLKKKRSRKITVTTDSFFSEVALAAAVKGAMPQLARPTMESLRLLRDSFDLYLLVKVSSDHEEAAMKEWLQKEEFDVNKVIFHETLEGKVHIVRQLQPTIHIDGSRVTAEQLVDHIKQVIVVGGSAGSSQPVRGLEFTDSLSKLSISG